MYRGVLMLAGFELKSNIGSNKIESHISSLIVLLATTQIRQRHHKRTEQTKSPSTHHYHTHKKPTKLHRQTIITQTNKSPDSWNEPKKEKKKEQKKSEKYQKRISSKSRLSGGGGGGGENPIAESGRQLWGRHCLGVF